MTADEARARGIWCVRGVVNAVCSYLLGLAFVVSVAWVSCGGVQ